MHYISLYPSPLGDMLLAADDVGLTGVWFAGQKYYARSLPPEHRAEELPVFAQAKRWLDIYFSGREPDFALPLHLTGTPFQQAVWELLRTIPYGQTRTYGSIAAELGLPPGAARAVGGAVGRNPISLFVPCHRVVGAKGSLTGYAGGLERKTALLALENAL